MTRCLSARARSASWMPACAGAARRVAADRSRRNRSAARKAHFLGSVPTGTPSGTTLSLSLKDAFDRALTHNLGLVESDQQLRIARAERLRELNALLPDISGAVSGSRQQLNLAAAGLTFTIPGVNLPSVVGPFGVADARVYATQQIVNWADIKRWKSSAESERASQHSNRSDRDIVILAAGNAYLKVISGRASVEATRAQLTTARTLHERAVDRNRSGVVASIDVLRARVELQTQQQRLIAAENQLAIDKLMLARIIGLPKGQVFEISDECHVRAARRHHARPGSRSGPSRREATTSAPRHRFARRS